MRFVYLQSIEEPCSCVRRSTTVSLGPHGELDRRRPQVTDGVHCLHRYGMSSGTHPGERAAAHGEMYKKFNTEGYFMFRTDDCMIGTITDAKKVINE